MSSDAQAKEGMLFAALAFTMWGVAPVYFKQLLAVPAHWKSLPIVYLVGAIFVVSGGSVASVA